MPRNLNLIAACALALVFCAPRAQDPAHLALARRHGQAGAERTKPTKPPAKVITNDDMPSGSRGAAPRRRALGRHAQPGSRGQFRRRSFSRRKARKTAIMHRPEWIPWTAQRWSARPGGQQCQFSGPRQVGRRIIRRQANLCVAGSRHAPKSQANRGFRRGHERRSGSERPSRKGFWRKAATTRSRSQDNSAAFQAVIDGRQGSRRQADAH